MMYMSDTHFVLVLCNKIELLSDILVQNLHITYLDSIKLIYNSNLFNALADESCKMWYYSCYVLYDFLLEELENKKLKTIINDEISKDVKDQIIWMIEFFKIKKKLLSKDVYNLFEKYGIFSYIKDCYEYIAHLTTEDAVKDIEDILAANGYAECKENKKA